MELGMTTVWIGLIIVAIIVEMITVGLVSIWFIPGGAVAALVSECGGPIWLQIIVFVAVSVLCMVFTRPWAVKHLNARRVRTNVDEVVGSQVRVTETIDNKKETGRAIHNGLEWTARARDPERVIAEGEMVTVAEVSGVKLIVE